MPGKTKKHFGTKRQEMAHKADSLCKMKTCHFSKQEIERLLQLFKEFTKTAPNEVKRGKGGIDRTKFRDILHQHFDMTDDVLMDKVFKAFDLDNDGYVSEEEWVLGMSIFLKGAIDEQSRFCFGVYSMRGEDGYISREDMYLLLKNCLVQHQQEEDAEEMQKDLVEMALKKIDFDHDGRVSVEDYMKSVAEESLLIEALGPCLPNTKTRESFLELIADDKQKKHRF
ncbi:EFCB1-like protein [Mya arenaria]|uniref:EFCB1-like protein n=1 Tax=Mya arenaria TaxID=6604 RepID=A0ABY7D859_MYAAR|nr:calaxin-like [Mya arenaria]WAQ93564.1 EFCB1-like protein [Mya arenaria]